MHEMALTESLVEIALEEARKHQAHRIKAIRLDIGAFSCVVPDALQFCFEAVSAGTFAEGAALEISHIAGSGWCLDCAKTVALNERFGACPHCGQFHVQMTGGDDLKIRDMEIE